MEKYIAIKCPHCGETIRICERNGEYVAVPFLDAPHSPTHDDLETLSGLGIELGVVPADRPRGGE